MTAPAWSWKPAPTNPTRPTREVHVWAVRLDSPDDRSEQLALLLSEDERSRAAAFHFARHRRRFVVARGALRRILAVYADIPPANLRFSYGAKGKPVLARETGGEALRFNLSHSHDLAVCAVTCGREIGIDVERVREGVEIDAIVERFFSERERLGYRGEPQDRRREVFFRLWTRKEAYIKARGDGFSLPPSRFDVTVGANEPPRLLAVEGEPLEPSRWSVRDLAPAPEFLGAVFVEGRDWQLECWRWEP